MRNRAKCKLCKDIIESFHRHDFVECSCKEIFIDGGNDLLRAGAKDFNNFLRVNDNDEETPVTLVDEEDFKKVPLEQPPLTRQDKLDMLKGMIDSYDRLPQHALLQPVTNADMASSLLLIYEILKD